MEGISLLGWQAATIVVAFLAVVLVALLWRARATRALGVRVVVWSVVGTSALALVVHGSGLVPTDIPRWFYVVALLPFVGPALALAGWPALRPLARTVALVCLPLGLLASVLVVNQHYEYWPTVGAMLGHDHSDPLVDAAHLTAMLRGPGAGDLTHGLLVDLAIPGTVSGFHARTARLWLPPAYLAEPDRRRPVVEFIGGTPGWTSDWTRSARLDRAADRLAADHGGEAPLLLMVDANGSAFGDTECVDGPRGNAETYLTVDVPAYLRSHFHVDADRSGWGVAGYSEGGTCALTLALRHHDQYSAFVDLAGDAHPTVGGHHHTVQALFRGSEDGYAAHDPGQLLAASTHPDLAGWFGWGRADGRPRHDTVALAAAARASGVAVEEQACRGGHDFGFVTSALGQALPWISDRLEGRVRVASHLVSFRHADGRGGPHGSRARTAGSRGSVVRSAGDEAAEIAVVVGPGREIVEPGSRRVDRRGPRRGRLPPRRGGDPRGRGARRRRAPPGGRGRARRRHHRGRGGVRGAARPTATRRWPRSGRRAPPRSLRRTGPCGGTGRRDRPRRW